MKNKNQKLQKLALFHNLTIKLFVLVFIFQCIFPSTVVAQFAAGDADQETTEQVLDQEVSDDQSNLEGNVLAETEPAGKSEIIEENDQKDSISTPEIDVFSNLQPELKEDYAQKRDDLLDKKILEKLVDREFTEKDLLVEAKENGIDGMQAIDPNAANGLIEELKDDGVITTLTDKSGVEKELNPELRQGSDKDYFQTKNTPYEIQIPLDSDNFTVFAENEETAGMAIDSDVDKTVQSDFTPDTKEQITYLMRGANKTNAVQNENKVLYKDILKEVDLLLTTLEEGVKEDIILKNSDAPLYFDYVIETTGLELVVNDDGSLSFVDEMGQKKFYTPPPNITDVNGFVSYQDITYELGWNDEVKNTDTNQETTESAIEEEGLVEENTGQNEENLDENTDLVPEENTEEVENINTEDQGENIEQVQEDVPEENVFDQNIENNEDAEQDLVPAEENIEEVINEEADINQNTEETENNSEENTEEESADDQNIVSLVGSFAVKKQQEYFASYSQNLISTKEAIFNVDYKDFFEHVYQDEQIGSLKKDVSVKRDNKLFAAEESDSFVVAEADFESEPAVEDAIETESVSAEEDQQVAEEITLGAEAQEEVSGDEVINESTNNQTVEQVDEANTEETIETENFNQEDLNNQSEIENINQESAQENVVEENSAEEVDSSGVLDGQNDQAESSEEDLNNTEEIVSEYEALSDISSENSNNTLSESEMEFFAPEGEKNEILDLHKFDMQQFEKSSASYQETETPDGVVRRYKVRLKIKTRETENVDQNAITLNSGMTLSYPLDIDPTFYVVTFDSIEEPTITLGQPSNYASGANNTKEAWNLYNPRYVFKDSAGHLIVSDYNNNRVKIWNTEPTSYDSEPDIVLGQLDQYATNTGMNISDFVISGPMAVYSDGTRLAVVSYSHNRVLIWNTFPTESGQPADIVLGQADFVSSSSGVTTSAFNSPTGVYFTADKFLVADYANHRVLIWNSFPTANGQAADMVLGQYLFTTSTANNGGIGAGTLYNPTTVWTDGTKLLVSDYSNNRVLVWNTFPTKNKQDADVVIGQDDFVSNGRTTAVNRLSSPASVYYDGSKLFITNAYSSQVFIYNSMPSSNGASADLVLGSSAGTTQSRMNAPNNVFSDGTKVYVSDYNNHRVLVWNSMPTATAQNADFVLGQADFTSNITAPSTINGSELSSPRGVFKDINGRVFVADYNNNRVLIWNTEPDDFNVPADIVLGQTSMSAVTSGCANNKLYYPSSVYSDGNRLLVSDTNNHRILAWNTIPTTNGQAADMVIGQTSFTSCAANNGSGTGALSNDKGLYAPKGITIYNNKLFVVDSGNNRILAWNTIPTTNGQAADMVIGQEGFEYNKTNRFSGLTTTPQSVFKDVNGYFYIVDSDNNRILIWFTEPLNDDTPPDVVVGQPDFVQTGGNNPSMTYGLNTPRAVYSDGVRLFVADYGNNRVLIWNTIPTTNGKAPDLVLGQSSFTTNSANNGGISASSLYNPAGVYSDGERLYVHDTRNQRVLIWNSMPTTNGKAADLVLGQNTMACNVANNNGSCASSSIANNNFSFYYSNANQPIAGDDTYLYVADQYHNRVMVWEKDNISANMQSADYVIGQVDFTTNVNANGSINGLYTASSVAVNDDYVFIACADSGLRIYNKATAFGTKVANVYISGGFSNVVSVSGQKLYSPTYRVAWNSIPTTSGTYQSFSYYFSRNPSTITGNGLNNPIDINISSDGKMIISDYGNNRVLVWNEVPTSNQVSPDVVVGQAIFSTNGSATNANGLKNPYGVFTDNEGRLYISDYNNHRVLVWKEIPEKNGIAADFVVGQTSFTTSSAYTDGITANTLYNPTGIFSDNQKLYIADTNDGRILVKPIDFLTEYQVSPDRIIGQPSYYTDYANYIEINDLYQPTSVFKDSVGRFYLVDKAYNRVKIWNTEPADNTVEPDLVLGQAYRYRTDANDGGVSARSMNAPWDAYSDGNRLVVSDYSNGRVLIWNEFPTNEDPDADLVLGQLNFSGTYGNRASNPSADTVSGPKGVLIVGNKLIVADSINNRVLIWNEFPTEMAQPADVVLGQPDFGSTTANNGGISASTLSAPSGLWSNGTNLMVADESNNRTLVWNNIPTVNQTAADFVIGQASFTSSSGSSSASGASSPTDIESDGTKLFISNRVYNSVYVYNTIPTATGASANYVIGQTGFGANDTTTDTLHLSLPYGFCVADGKIYIANHNTNRVLIWNSIPTTSGVSADKVLGQSSFTTAYYNTRDGKGLYSPYDVFVDVNGKLFVADASNHRILIWNSFPASNQTPADVVLGQSDMTTANSGRSASALNYPRAVYSDGTNLFVADYYNNRVLIWNGIPTTNNEAADVVIGQANFTAYDTLGDNSYITSSSVLSRPMDVFEYNGKLLVSDGNSNRVLVWNSIPTTNGQAADVVIGQRIMETKTANFPEVYSFSGDDFSDLAKDASGRYYFLDRSYHRILIFNSKPTSRNQTPDVVIGQPNRYQVNSNGGSSISASVLNTPSGLAIYGDKLIVADTGNQRVLIWNTLPTTDYQAADVVLGQVNFTTATVNYGGRSASSLNNPMDVVVTADGKLLVADRYNYRVLIWNSIPTVNNTVADLVIGQSDFTSATTNSTDLIHLNQAYTISLSGDSVLVSGASKSMIWNTFPTTNGQSADYYEASTNYKYLVHGDWLYKSNGYIYKTAWPLATTPSWEIVGSAYTSNMEDFGDGDYFYTFNNGLEEWDIPCDTCADNYSTDMVWAYLNAAKNNTLNSQNSLYVDGNGKLYIADTSNNRILVYNSIPTSNGENADVIFGNLSYTREPRSIFVRDDGRTYVTDIYRRIQYWETAPTGTVRPDKTFGQKKLNGTETYDTGPSSLTTAYGLCGDDNGLYVADTSNNRVLMYKYFNSPLIDSLSQYENDGTTEIPLGDSTYSGETNNIVVKADLNNPTDEAVDSQLKMFVEVQKLEDDFVSAGSNIYDLALMASDPENGDKVTSGTGIYESTFSSLGDYTSSAYNAVVNITGLDSTLYKWRAIAYNGTQYSYWQRYGSCQSFVIASPSTPVFASAEQYKTDATTAITNQTYTNETAVRLKAHATDADTSSSLVFYFEVRDNTDSFSSPAIPNICDACPSGTGFDDCDSKIWYVALDEGNYTSTAAEGVVHVLGLDNGEYKWQVNVSDGGNFTGWNAYNATTPNFEVDYLLPVFTVTDGVGTNWNSTDTIAVSVVDQGPSDIKETRWNYSDDNLCNSSDVFPYIGTSTDVDSYQKYVCFKSTDNAGNIAYSLAIGPLKWDITGPTFVVSDDANPVWNTSDTVTVTVTDPNSPYPTGSGVGATTYWGYSSNAVCDSSDTYPNTGTSTSAITTDHTDYVCFTNTDQLGNVGYSRAIGPLRVGTEKPTFTLLDGVSSVWNTEDTIAVSATASVGATIGTTYWGYSSDAGCDSNDSYPNTGSSLVVNSGPNTNYVCFTNTDTLSRTGYSEPIGPLKWDTTKPVVSSLAVSPSAISPGGIGTINADVSDTGSGLSTCKAWLSLFPGIPALLIHSNNDAGSTVFTDSSENGYTFNLHSGVRHSIAQKKFGKSSILFDGNNSYLSVDGHNDDWNFSTDDFTIDFWVYPALANLGQNNGLISSIGDVSTDQGWSFELDTNGQIRFFDRNSSDTVVVDLEGTVLNVNNWYHVAVVRDGDNFTLYVNGQAVDTGIATGEIDNNNSALWIGSRNHYQSFNGYIDEIRVLKGVARWTSDFSSSLPTTIHNDETSLGDLGTDCDGQAVFPTAIGDYYVIIRPEDVAGNGQVEKVAVSVTLNASPVAPTSLQVDGEGGTLVPISSVDPKFTAVFNDDTGDLISRYRIQVDDDPDFSSPIWDNGVDSGTEIANCNDLQNINNDLSGNYYLSADLDCADSVTWNSGAGFIPLGNTSTPFTGYFDGRNHTISNLYIDNSSLSNAGLFGVASDAYLKDLTLANVDFTADNYLGALAGKVINTSTIENCASSGSVFATTYAGGLVGSLENTSKITKSSSAVNVSANENAGGLVALNNSKILNSFTSGTIISQINTGGVVAVNSGEDARVIYSYSNGTVSGGLVAGGIIGMNTDGAEVIDSYSQSSVSGANSVGGVVGRNLSSRIVRVYAAGSIAGSGDDIGGLAGLDRYSDVVDSYWDSETTNQSESDGGGTAKTTSQMKQQASFANWDFATIWSIDESNDYPYLTWQDSASTSASAGERSSDIIYAGQDLENGTTYYYRIKFYDQYGAEGDWSASGASFDTDYVFDSLYIKKGDHQLGEESVPLADDLEVQAKTAYGEKAGAGSLVIDYELIQAPTGPAAENYQIEAGDTGQNFVSIDNSHAIVETDADGLASIKFTMGDRAGDYVVRAKYNNGTKDVVKDFTFKQLARFEMSMSDNMIPLKNNPAGDTNQKPITFDIDTNAANYKIYLKPNNFLIDNTGTYQIGNWSDVSETGFGWKLSTDTDFSSFADAPNYTEVYFCDTGDDCQGTRDISIDLGTAVDFSVPAGIYTDTVDMDLSEISY